jgi:ribosomal-protein-serine acetyltransferase
MFSIPIDAFAALELLQEEHAPDVFALVERNRTHLRQWLPWLDQNTSVEHTASFIRGALRRFADHNGMTCGIRSGATLVGVIGLHLIDWPNRKTSIGYWVGQEHQGKGLVTSACAVLLDHCFGDLALNRVEIQCAVANRRSCAIPERLGFTREGVLRQGEWLYDHFVDLASYALVASEWRGSAAFRARGLP